MIIFNNYYLKPSIVVAKFINYIFYNIFTLFVISGKNYEEASVLIIKNLKF